LKVAGEHFFACLGGLAELALRVESPRLGKQAGHFRLQGRPLASAKRRWRRRIIGVYGRDKADSLWE
jgi:hypothetical protein